jgi:hypothetical protein
MQEVGCAGGPWGLLPSRSDLLEGSPVRPLASEIPDTRICWLKGFCASRGSHRKAPQPAADHKLRVLSEGFPMPGVLLDMSPAEPCWRAGPRALQKALFPTHRANAESQAPPRTLSLRHASQYREVG